MIKTINDYSDDSFFHEETYYKEFKSDPFGFHFTQLVLGTAPAKEEDRILNLISDNKKTYVLCYASIYPFLLQLDTLLRFYEDQSKIDDVELIIDIVAIKNRNYGAWISEIFNNKKIRHRIVDSSEYDYLNVNNFVEIKNQDFEQNGIFRNLYNNTLSFVSNNPVQQPFRKVLISRKITPNIWYDEKRIDDHEKLEKIFIDNGFEICYPEEFKTFSEQVTYFNETKVLCGISGGGLTNSIFMQSGGKILELTTSYKFDYILPNGIDVEELHEYYLHIAWHRKHLITTLSNIDRKVDEIERQLERFRVFEWLKDYD